VREFRENLNLGNPLPRLREIDLQVLIALRPPLGGDRLPVGHTVVDEFFDGQIGDV
jgi:hypothetical protein